MWVECVGFCHGGDRGKYRGFDIGVGGGGLGEGCGGGVGLCNGSIQGSLDLFELGVHVCDHAGEVVCR